MKQILIKGMILFFLNVGIDIESDPNIDFFKPSQKSYPTGKLYWFGL